MRVQHTVTSGLATQYREALNRDLGIYHMQTGQGIGGFIGKMFKSLMPIGKSVFNAFKPELKKMGEKAITHVATSAYNKIGAKQTKNVDSKRKRKRTTLKVKRQKRDILT